MVDRRSGGAAVGTTLGGSLIIGGGQSLPARSWATVSLRSAPPRTRPLVGLLSAEVISTTGSEVTAVALPWFVLVSTGSPARMGAVLAAEFVGMAVLGLWGGPVASVLGARRMMLASDLLRAGLVALIPVLYWLDALSFPLVLAIGFAVGAFFPAYSSSQRLVLAEIV